MRRVALPLVVVSTLAVPLALPLRSAGADAEAASTTPPSASGSASGSAADSAAGSSSAAASPTSSATPSTTAFPRKKADPDEIEVITLEGEPEFDPQRFAVGLTAGGGWLDTRGSGAGAEVGNFGILGEFGLGQYGARAPLTLEVFASFALNRGSFSSSANVHPNRFTELGGRLVYRPESGFLADRWLSLGAGIVFTSWGQDGDQGNVAPGALLDVGAGLFEWKTRLVRYGFGLRVPVELSKHPGGGVLGFFYAQVGLGG